MLGIDIADLDSETLCNLLLYGSSNLNILENRIIIEATIEFIEKTTLGCYLSEGIGFSVLSLGGVLVSADQHNLNLT